MPHLALQSGPQFAPLAVILGTISMPLDGLGACAIPDNAYGRTIQYAVVSDERLYPLTLGLAAWNLAGTVTGFNPLYTVISPGALISILPLVLVFIFLGRYWRSGLTVGATKG